MAQPTLRLTMAQALVCWLCAQFSRIGGERGPLFAGVFGIFGHGKVTCLSGALARCGAQFADLEAAMEWVQTTDRTTLVSHVTAPYSWVPEDADRDVGVPEVSSRESVQQARVDQVEIRNKQRVGV